MVVTLRAADALGAPAGVRVVLGEKLDFIIPAILEVVFYRKIWLRFVFVESRMGKRSGQEVR